MKRVATFLFLASPLWILCGLGGWWLGSRESSSDLPKEPAVVTSEVPAAVPTRLGPAAPAIPPAKRTVRARVAAPKPAAPIAVAAPSPVQPMASLGSTDISAPEKVLAPAPAQASMSADAGVLIVVSLASQRAFVFKAGELWGSSPVSTGRRGKSTPVGRYTILEKQAQHRSTKYDDAPMPYMQRLTWGGVAIHAGHVTGRPTSHGCIRLPRAFAKRLYNLTDFSSTTVVVTDRKARSSDEARKAA